MTREHKKKLRTTASFKRFDFTIVFRVRLIIFVVLRIYCYYYLICTMQISYITNKQYRSVTA